VFTGTASPTQEADTSTANGTFDLGTFTGAAAVTQESDTSTASGTFTADPDAPFDPVVITVPFTPKFVVPVVFETEAV
jgi:hypothetical protein